MSQRPNSNAFGSIPYDADLLGNISQSLKALQGYDIMALELIQNADDAGASRLVINATDEALIIQNDAEFTSCGLQEAKCPWKKNGGPHGRKRECNFHAISLLGSRNKAFAEKQTGRFGIGFVSVYQITDRPQIRSAGIELTLDPLKQLNGFRKYPDVRGTEIYLPWAREHSQLRSELQQSPVPEDISQLASKEIASAISASCLFLRNLQTIRIEQNNRLSTELEIKRDSRGVELRIQPGNRHQRWLVLERDADDLIKRANLLEDYERLREAHRSSLVSVALPMHELSQDGLLYAYLPTTQKSRLPLHINGDFFPHASRQEISLRDKGHESVWNATLLETAAAILEENFLEIRDAVGAERLWAIGSAALETANEIRLESDSPFRHFWHRFLSAAQKSESVKSSKGNWAPPSKMRLSGDLSENESAAISELQDCLVDTSQRKHRNALLSAGARDLNLSRVLEIIEAAEPLSWEKSEQYLPEIWSIIDRMLASADESEVESFQGAKCLLATDLSICAAEELWAPPRSVKPSRVGKLLPSCPLIHDRVSQYENLARHIDPLTLEEFARQLKNELITNSVHADWGEETAKLLYSVLTDLFDRYPDSLVKSTLSDAPFLWTSQGFRAPEKCQLPSDFVDPTGYLAIVDKNLFPKRFEAFLEQMLDMSELDFADFVDQHVEDILEAIENEEVDAPKDVFSNLVREMLRHRRLLSGSSTIEYLRGLACVPVRSGEFKIPSECFFETEFLRGVLGNDPSYWVDTSWLPADSGRAVRDFFESDLGVCSHIPIRIIIQRIEEIAGGGISPSEAIRLETPLIEQIIEQWNSYSDDDREEFAKRLADCEFLPGLIDGEVDERHLYSPGEIYRATRAKGFESQVAVIALTPLRTTRTSAPKVLDALNVPSEPPIEAVVKHLLHCIDTKTPPNDQTYQMLGTYLARVHAGETGYNEEALQELLDHDVVFSGTADGFISTKMVFWERPKIGGQFWFKADDALERHRPLFQYLGIANNPGPTHYANLMKHIAQIDDIDAHCAGIHDEAFATLCTHIGHDEFKDAIAQLREAPSLLSLSGDAVFPDQAYWIDDDEYLRYLDEDQEQSVIRTPDGDPIVLPILFQKLGTPPISGWANLELAGSNNEQLDSDSTALLSRMAPALSWITEDYDAAQTLLDLVDGLEIRLCASLSVHAAFKTTPPSYSKPRDDCQLFFDETKKCLYLVADSIDLRGWGSVCGELFRLVSRRHALSGIKSKAGYAKHLVVCDDLDKAFEELIADGYSESSKPPSSDSGNEIGLTIDEEYIDFEVDAPENIEIFGTHEDDELIQADAQPYKSTNESGPADTPASRHSSSQTVSGDDLEPPEPATANGQLPPQADEQIETTGGYDTSRRASPLATGTENDQSAEASGLLSSRTDAAKIPTATDLQVRRARLRTYVGNSETSTSSNENTANGKVDINAIDSSAIKAVVAYEKDRGWSPVEMAHNNPGFDIRSTSEDGNQRIIEVKGLLSEWNERGVKLSHVQYDMARREQDDYWLYVVEKSTDPNQQKVYAIQNPFKKVDEYYFDNGWSELAEETTSATELNCKVGASVKHHNWGNGIIERIERNVFPLKIVVDFGDQGRKLLPLSKVELLGDG